MKRLILLLLLLTTPALSQTKMLGIFDSTNPNIIQNDEAKVFQGNPLVYIQGISDKPQAKSWMDQMKLKLFGSINIPQKTTGPELSANSSFTAPSNTQYVKVKPAFGPEKEIQYISHTSDWTFLLQMINDTMVSIQEDIHFLLTEDTELLVRDWKLDQRNFFSIKATLDNQPISLDNKTTSFTLKNLTSALHHLQLNYVVHLPKGENFNLPLIGSNWPLVVDSFTGVILKGSTILNNPHFLIGSNDQEIPQNFTIRTDEQGNIYFHNNHILPAHAQIKLAGTKNKILKYDSEDQLETYSPNTIYTISLIILVLYLLLSGLEVYFANFEYLLKRFKKIHSNIIAIWWQRVSEIIFGSIILLLIIFFVIKLNHMELINLYSLILLIVTLLGVTLNDLLIFKPKQKQIYQVFQNKKVNQ